MKLTSDLFEAFLKCATKCYLRSHGESGTGNEYAEWVRERNDAYRMQSVARWLESVPENELVVSPSADGLKAAKWRFAVDMTMESEGMESRLQAVERRPP